MSTPGRRASTSRLSPRSCAPVSLGRDLSIEAAEGSWVLVGTGNRDRAVVPGRPTASLAMVNRFLRPEFRFADAGDPVVGRSPCSEGPRVGARPTTQLTFQDAMPSPVHDRGDKAAASDMLDRDTAMGGVGTTAPGSAPNPAALTVDMLLPRGDVTARHAAALRQPEFGAVSEDRGRQGQAHDCASSRRWRTARRPLPEPASAHQGPAPIAERSELPRSPEGHHILSEPRQKRPLDPDPVRGLLRGTDPGGRCIMGSSPRIATSRRRSSPSVRRLERPIRRPPTRSAPARAW